MIVVLRKPDSGLLAAAKMSAQNRFCQGNRTSCNSIKQYPLQSGCIRNVHYPLKSGNFVQRVEKNRTERDILFRFLVEVTGFEPATFWSRKPVHASIIVPLGPLFLPEKPDYSSGTFQPYLHQNPYLNYRPRLSVGTRFQFSDLSVDMIETNH